MAELSKLPEIAVLPSFEMASARTGPPWPRSWACAASSATRKVKRQKIMLKTIIPSFIAQLESSVHGQIYHGCGDCGIVLRSAPQSSIFLRDEPEGSHREVFNMRAFLISIAA